MARSIDWKRRFGALGLGIVVFALVYAFVLFFSNELRLVYALGAIFLLWGAMWVGAKGKGAWLNGALVAAPLIAAFGFLVLPKHPYLWPHLLLWLLIAVISAHLLRPARRLRILAMCGTGLLVAASLWYYVSYMPQEVARSRSHFQDAEAPTFVFQAVGDRPVPTRPVPGKVLVIDFFATTCAPCIAELPELARARTDLRDKADIDFLVVASDAGGDTPEGFRSYAQRHHLALPLAFDSGGKAHAAFGLTGVPALVVLDRTGRVRFTHEGYSPSETNFRSDLVRLLQSL
jgi:thiol-disulfide isomerase/thioredoxin